VQRKQIFYQNFVIVLSQIDFNNFYETILQRFIDFFCVPDLSSLHFKNKIPMCVCVCVCVWRGRGQLGAGYAYGL
jgi:hypothetical protein